MSSCSFQSNQFDILRNAIFSSAGPVKPVKNWVAYWADKRIQLYAINIQDQVIFADETINIFYKDKQIYKVTGLPHENSVLEIESKGASLLFLIDGKRIGTDSCDLDYLISTENFGENYTRSCVQKSSRKIYKNQIIFNSDGLIVNMTFKVHPDYPPLKLSMK